MLTIFIRGPSDVDNRKVISDKQTKQKETLPSYLLLFIFLRLKSKGLQKQQQQLTVLPGRIKMSAAHIRSNIKWNDLLYSYTYLMLILFLLQVRTI